MYNSSFGCFPFFQDRSFMTLLHVKAKFESDVHGFTGFNFNLV